MMDHILAAWGVGFVATSARKAVMKPAGATGQQPPNSFLLGSNGYMDIFRLKQASLDCDDAMSVITASSSSDDSSFCSTRGLSVTFAPTVVSATHYRPRTRREEKSQLFYTDADYRSFRHEFIYGRRRGKRVNFSSSLVSEVWGYEVDGEKSSLYYSEADLQRCVKVLLLRYKWDGGYEPSSHAFSPFLLLQIFGRFCRLIERKRGVNTKRYH